MRTSFTFIRNTGGEILWELVLHLLEIQAEKYYKN